MGAFDKLESYKAHVGLEQAEETLSNFHFDNDTVDGAFLNLLEKNGFEMVLEDGTPTELQAVLRQQGNLYIQAVAGAGKTTSLVLKIMYDILSGELMQRRVLPNGMEAKVLGKVFVGTFLRTGADELKQKLAHEQRKYGQTVTANQIVFGTLHAEFKRALNAMGVKTNIGSQTTLSGLMQKAIKDCNIKRTDGRAPVKEDFKIIEAAVAYYRGRVGKDRYPTDVMSEYGMTPTIMDLLVNQYHSLKDQAGVMDFDDLQDLLYKFCYEKPNAAVIQFLQNRYDYMYLDEFQDTSQKQYALIRVYMQGVSKHTNVKKKGKIVVVGDVQQCIYSFRGSDINVMYRYFDQDFDSVHMQLSYNRRCPENILTPIIPSISLNAESKGITIQAANKGGVFHCYGYSGIDDMMKDLKEQVEEDLSRGENVAILCRTNYDGMIPAIYLELQGKYDYSISSDAMTMKSALAKRLLRVSSIFTDRGTKALKDTLEFFVSMASSYALSQMCDTMKQNNRLIWEIPLSDIKHSCNELYEIVKDWRDQRDNGMSDIELLEYIYLELYADYLVGNSGYVQSAKAIIEVLLEVLRKHNFKTIAEFRDKCDILQDRMESALSREGAVSIATVHEFKGKERDNIYVWNDSKGTFPPVRAGKTATGVEKHVDIDEERRVHYIACTRAKKKSVLLCKESSPSQFIKDEMKCTIEKRQKQVTETEQAYEDLLSVATPTEQNASA